MDSNNFSTPLPAEIWDIILGYTNLEHSFLIAENSEDIENLNNAISDESFRAIEKVNKVFYKYLSSKQLNLCTAFIFDSSWREKINISRVLFLSQDSLQTSFFINLHFKSILRCKTLLSSVVEKVALQGRTLCLNHFSIEDIDSKIRELALIETSFKVKKIHLIK